MKAICIIIGLLVLPAMVYNEKSIQLKGTVIDAVERVPLNGSHVYVKGTHIGAVSDENGEFSLQVPLIYQNRPLIISYVGYETYEEKISAIEQFELQIAMKPAVIALDEIMVMPGKEILVDQAIDMVLAEYDDQEEMLSDFYTALFFIDQDRHVLNKVLNDGLSERN
jgi:hypothetical protein